MSRDDSETPDSSSSGDPGDPYTLSYTLLSMKKYELVTVVDANLSATEIKDVNTQVQKLLWSAVLDTDDIGLMPTAYPLLGQDQAYYVSYLVELDSTKLDELKSDLKLIKPVAKFTLFSMWVNEKFLKMADLTKRREDMMPKVEETPQEEVAAEKEVEVVESLDE